jgi:hypothetical protein
MQEARSNTVSERNRKKPDTTFIAGQMYFFWLATRLLKG